MVLGNSKELPHDFRRLLFLLATLIALNAPAVRAQSQIPWHGYVQTRYVENFDDLSSFRIRRAKLWLDGKAPVEGNWHYKLQGIFVEKNNGGFTLQDAFAEYRYRDLRIRAGQQIPDFSLQRHQPDFVIPVVERAAAINMLIPASETSARDIGVQVFFNSQNKHWHTSVGMFNGNGANQLTNEDRQFLFSHRTTYSLPLRQGLQGHLGYSFAYRKTDGLAFKKIYGAGTTFSGDDFRWGLEARLHAAVWEIQAEYIRANLEDDDAWAAYLLTDYQLTTKNQVVASVEKYEDLNPATDDNPWYILGFNHYFDGNLAKIMLDGRAQFAEKDTNYQAIVQLQIMFH